MKKAYITTAIPYVNARPHIGHAMDYLLADIWARSHGGARFSAGLDEHGTKIETKAASEHKSPQAFVDELAPVFKELLKKMNISNTDFIRTTDPKHVERAREIWRKLDAAGVIYKGTYEGWYCAGCEGFVTEEEARKTNYTCPDHHQSLEKVSEENYYLRVSRFTDEIREFAKNNIVPAWRGKEILELVKDGAKDVSISRPVEKLKWGIPVPGDESHVMYVWIDALSNYLTTLGYPDESIADYWPADVQVVGKDILRFHAIIWPAMLLALGLELPRKMLVHGWVLTRGDKMSKSLGNVVDPIAMVDEFGTDAFRYFFARHIPTFDDGDFTREKFVEVYTSELANNLGNLVSRVANMIEKYLGGTVGKSAEFSFDRAGYDKYMNDFRFDLALGEVMRLAGELNGYVDENKPWALAKSAPKKNAAVLAYLAAGLREVAELLAPFLPATAARIAKVFNAPKIAKLDEVLFPRVDG
jgi:methionyl-tRNA synthetase